MKVSDYRPLCLSARQRFGYWLIGRLERLFNSPTMPDYHPLRYPRRAKSQKA